MSDSGFARVVGLSPRRAEHGEVKDFASRYGVAPGSINPNLFQDQEYKYGSFGNPDPSIRKRALQHTKDSIEIARRLNSRDISLWFADGSNYPGTANIRQTPTNGSNMHCRKSHRELSPEQRMLVEYKPFEPAFYHTDIADWGMALLLSRSAGPRAKVWSIPAIIMRRKISSKSWHGCCQRTCSAVSISMIAAMPTTI